MAWIKATHDLPDKAEVVAISTRLGIDQDAVVGKLLRVWIWFDRETTNGVTSGVTPSVTDRIAFCPGFGRAMEAVGWMVFNDDGSASLPNFDDHNSETAKERAVTAKRVAKHRRLQLEGVTETVTQTVTSTVTSETESESESSVLQKSKVSQNRTSIGETSRRPAPAGSDSDLSGSDLLEISGEEVERAAPLAESLFQRAKYSGTDGGLLWKIAVLVGRGIVPESLAHDAAEGAKLNAKRNPVGFLRKTLAETCAKRGIDLDLQIARVQMPKGSPTGRPKNAFREEMRELASGIGAIK